MAHKPSFLLSMLLLATTALAQTADARTSPDATKTDLTTKQIVLARCAYGQPDEICRNPQSTPPRDVPSGDTLAQLRPHLGPIAGRQGPPQGPPGRSPESRSMRGPVYPENWGPQFSPGHALVGGAIGFVLGAASGSKNGVRASLAVGTIVGLIGAAIGAGIPTFPNHYRNRRPWDDDEEASRRKPDFRSHSISATRASRQDAVETYQSSAQNISK